jgi:hypothetical protein
MADLSEKTGGDFMLPGMFSHLAVRASLSIKP